MTEKNNQPQPPQQQAMAYPYAYLSQPPPGQPQQQYHQQHHHQYWQQQHNYYQQQMYSQYYHYQQQHYQQYQQQQYNNSRPPQSFHHQNQRFHAPNNNWTQQSNNQNYHANNRFQRNSNIFNNNNNRYNPYNNNNNNNNNLNQNNKTKIDKRDLPENNRFFCEACDRGFKSDDKYQEHLATHRTCGVNGCKFTAAEKLVEIHYRNFHATGLHKRVSSLDTEDDIKRYIEERKKNFPSKDNVTKKIEFNEERVNRGAILHTKNFGKFRNNKFNNKLPNDENESQNVENEEKSSPNHNDKHKKFPQNKRHSPKKNFADAKTRKPTLLEKLLADEIRHERNILLQSVRFIVENNFFEDHVETPASLSSPSPSNSIDIIEKQN